MINLDKRIQDNIIKSAIQAPSGDNAQPFVFKWNGPVLEIYHDPILAYSRTYNFDQMSSLVSLGALINVISLTTNALSHAISQIQFTEELGRIDQPDLPWVIIEFCPQRPILNSEKVLDKIKLRHVNREAYNGGQFNPEIIKNIKRDLLCLPGQSIEFINFNKLVSNDLEELIEFLSYSETFLFHAQNLIEDVGKWIWIFRGTSEKRKDGMHWSQVNMKFFEVPLLLLLRLFPKLISDAYFKGLGKVLRMNASKIIRTSAGLVIIWSTQPDNKINLVRTGEIGNEIWINLNNLGFGVQPLTAISLTASYFLATNNERVVDPRMLTKLKEGQNLLRKICGKSDSEWPLWILRSGVAEALPASKRSLRRS